MKNLLTFAFLTLLAVCVAQLLTGCAPKRYYYVGKQGPAGAQGNQGDQGEPGQDGTDGVDATPVTIINLCPGVSSYPGVFIEVAICLNNDLYGVYSANGGFMTLLPPGNYSSNAIGSACNLTIHANCIVTH